MTEPSDFDDALLQLEAAYTDQAIWDRVPGQLPPPRPHQAEAATQVLDAFRRVDLVVLDAPTGAGKTILGEMVRRQLPFTEHRRSLYVCSSKILQEQVVHDPTFAGARLLKGRRNYTPETFDPKRLRAMVASNPPVTCEDCHIDDEGSCDWCDEVPKCPYRRARDAALGADLAVINTAYWLTEANHAGKFGHGARYLAIVDEADLLDDAVTAVAEVRVSAYRMRKFGWTPPPHSTTGPRTTAAWVAWIDQHLPKLRAMMDSNHRQQAACAPSQTKSLVQLRRDYAYMLNLYNALKSIREDLKGGRDSGWVRTGDVDSEVCWKPVWPSVVTKRLLWPHASKWLLMSASIISPTELVDRLGWDRPFEPVHVPSTFPVENRPIHILPVGDMSRQGPPQDRAAVIQAVRALCEEVHPDDRVLVHAVSYDLANAIVEGLRGLHRPVITYRGAANMDLAVADYKLRERAILVAPSLERGLSLDDDLARAVIIAKVPFPYLGDPLVKARTYPQGSWYPLEALRRMVQMTGRAVRHDKDFASAYILDRQFTNNLWRKVGPHAPKWWADALQWRADPDLLGIVGLIKRQTPLQTNK